MTGMRARVRAAWCAGLVGAGAASGAGLRAVTVAEFAAECGCRPGLLDAGLQVGTTVGPAAVVVGVVGVLWRGRAGWALGALAVLALIWLGEGAALAVGGR
ncbi:hypothetical protein BIV57_06765 [Mangrovactinospora gilvigrisea]|uniref:Uncharacterized protein n=1 Tax=Mangrovactinospora gilvigrisea TaxID=1428644 RepID=A0A1J7BHV8_9ACTN|nr:hypothetical protein [Mangrovactinospora gilvigrisea]OIV38230.1 hypothetical protein BIV57_06765 [Mangrovactinospora gilvigrisea]